MAAQGTKRAKIQGKELWELERENIVKALAATRGVKSGAAWLLGLSYSTIYRKMKSFEIEPTEYLGRMR